MKLSFFRLVFLTLISTQMACANELSSNSLITIKFTDMEVSNVGPVERISIEVPCGKIASIQNIPDLYNIEVGYDIPTKNDLVAKPRLGGAEVTLNKWSNVFVVSSNSEECFDIMVQVEGRKGKLVINLNQLRGRQ